MAGVTYVYLHFFPCAASGKRVATATSHVRFVIFRMDIFFHGLLPTPGEGPKFKQQGNLKYKRKAAIRQVTCGFATRTSPRHAEGREPWLNSRKRLWAIAGPIGAPFLRFHHLSNLSCLPVVSARVLCGKITGRSAIVSTDHFTGQDVREFGSTFSRSLSAIQVSRSSWLLERLPWARSSGLRSR